MSHTNNPIIKNKAGLLNLEEELGNISKACKIMGISSDTFYRYQDLVKAGDTDSLVNKTRRTANIKNRVDEATGRAVFDYTLKQPAHGQHYVIHQITKIDAYF